MTYLYWKQVQLWGGGFFQRILIHPTVANHVVCGCDIAGFYKLNFSKNSWELIGDFPIGEDNYWGAGSFAWHPTNPNIFWFASGKYTTGSLAQPGGVFKSVDGGKTLQKLSFPQIPFGANQNQRRLAGERLVVCPTNPNILLFGVYSDSSAEGKGVYRSIDGGTSWTHLPFSTLAPGQTIPSINNQNGQTSLVFDDRGGIYGGTCYCAMFGLGVVRSVDYGQTWSFIGGAKYIYKLVSYQGTIYSASIYTGSGELTADNGGYAGLSYYNGTWNSLILNKDLAWVDINRFTGQWTAGYHYDTYWKRSGESGTYQIGDSYFNTVSYQDGIPYPVQNGAGCFVYDPVVANRAWFGDYYYIWKNTKYSDSSSTWINIGKGVENTVPYECAFIKGSNAFYSTWYDIFAFKHDRGFNKTPSSKVGGAGNKAIQFPSAFSVDYCLNSSNTIAIVGSDYGTNADIVATKDSGVTWKKYVGTSLVSRVRISSSNPDLWVVLQRKNPPKFTSDGGTTWQNISAPNCVQDEYYYLGQPIASDPNNGNRFWLIDDKLGSATYGNLYRLDYVNNDFSVTLVGTIPVTYDGAKYTSLKVEGDRLWISCHDLGLYYSDNGGQSFAQITQVQYAKTLCFGAPPDGLTTPTLYIYGRIEGIESVWQSLDNGIAWNAKLEPILNSKYNVKGIFQTPIVLSASPNNFEELFLGTDGHGGFYSSDSGNPPPSILPGGEPNGNKILYLIY